jgi:3-dehydroquinate dehydratase-2
MITIAIINGPNLNTLGTRQPKIYGTTTLLEVEKNLHAEFAKTASLSFFQSNHEGALIDHLQSLKNFDAIVINPGALTHTSVALRDALVATELPVIEVHVSNILGREPFRHHSFISSIALGIICGLGTGGYALAVRGLVERLAK